MDCFGELRVACVVVAGGRCFEDAVAEMFVDEPDGDAQSIGVTATPSLWALGRVALNVAVRPNWTFENTGTQAVTLGTPHVEIAEGCCPGALTYTGPTTLQPDQSTELTFELSMRPGMDGAHDMKLHVPVQYADGTSTVLDLAVTGDFRG